MGGFSGPHLFDRTVSLVKRYRKLLMEKPPTDERVPQASSALQAEAQKIKSALETPSGSASSTTPDAVTASVDTGVIPPQPIPEQTNSEKQPLFNLPKDRFYDKPVEEQDSIDNPNASFPDKPSAQPIDEVGRLQAIQEAIERLPPREQRDAFDKLETPIHLASNDQPKVIFATGGITNGKQALEVLNAGANVAMVYTALVYGGVGTVSRIKDEMREEMRRQAAERYPKVLGDAVKRP
jgi:dihydroorotate dehydrogenase